MRLFSKLWSYLRLIKHYIIAAALVFAAGVILGYFNSGQFAALMENLIEQLSDIVRNASASENQQLSLIWLIFKNNMTASLMAVFSGIFFALLPISTLVMNGMLLGYLLHKASEQSNAAEMFFKGILPHGIIELPAVIIACAFGIRLGALVIMSLVNVFRPAHRGQSKRDFLDFFYVLLPFFILLATALLAAATIEGTLTFWLLHA